jgi:hypothetical protein
MPKHGCNVADCKWTSGEQPNHAISGCLASWHVYEEHPEIWKRVIGDRPPNDPDPRDPAVFATMSFGRV